MNAHDQIRAHRLKALMRRQVGDLHSEQIEGVSIYDALITAYARLSLYSYESVAQARILVEKRVMEEPARTALLQFIDTAKKDG